MSKQFAAPRGTADILPDETSLWVNLEHTSREILKSYGYREIRTPLYEDTNLFKRSLGQTSDIVHKQLLELKTDKDEGYSLRPEATASIVRAYLEHSFDKREPLSKFFYLGPMYRGERPQKGRLRQFHQIGAEAIGPDSTSPYLDAEIIVLAMHLVRAFGPKNPQLTLNSLGSKEDKAQISGWLRQQLAPQRSHLCEECQDRFERNIFRILDCKKEPCRKIISTVVKNLPLSAQSTQYFQNVQQALRQAGIDFVVSPHLVRGLDYYVHTVFEITAEGLGSQDAVGAGGRYSGLLQDLGGDPKVSYGAVGFALGVERLLLASQPAAPVESLNAFIVAMDPAYLAPAFELLNQLRQAGLSADMGFNGGSIKSQLNRANRLNAQYALILGENEFKSQSVAVKNMQQGSQETIALKEIVEKLRTLLGRKG